MARFHLFFYSLTTYIDNRIGQSFIKANQFDPGIIPETPCLRRIAYNKNFTTTTASAIINISLQHNVSSNQYKWFISSHEYILEIIQENNTNEMEMC